MTPANRTDHELLLQILDEMKPIKDFVRASGAAMWGKQNDSNDIGLVGRMKSIEDCAEENDKRSRENDARIKAIELFIASLQPWLKVLIFVGATLAGSFIALIWSLITGQFILVIP